MSGRSAPVLRLPALEIRQGPGREFYTFAVDGKDIPRFASVSRIHRTGLDLGGYQRPEVLTHVSAIKAYVESGSPLLPNPIVIAFDDRVRFEPGPDGTDLPPFVRPGTLIVPVAPPDGAGEDRPGWIVDGQQRTAAIRDADVEGFPVAVSAFITRSESEQRSQFILVNSTKPLPKGLIYELLPTTAGPLPPALARKRFPTLVLERMNFDEESPFFQLIQTPTSPGGVIKDNSILRMLENSLSDGALYHYRDPDTGGGDLEQMLVLLNRFWAAVRDMFPDAWGLPPRRSRLMHGVGIVSMGFLMDATAPAYLFDGVMPTRKDFLEELGPLRDRCAWTYGDWHLGPDAVRRWNDFQNTAKDTKVLTDHLYSLYTGKV